MRLPLAGKERDEVARQRDRLGRLVGCGTGWLPGPQAGPVASYSCSRASRRFSTSAVSTISARAYRIEGICRDPATDPIFEAFERGEIDATDIVRRLKIHYGIRPCHWSGTFELRDGAPRAFAAPRAFGSGVITSSAGIRPPQATEILLQAPLPGRNQTRLLSTASAAQKRSASPPEGTARRKAAYSSAGQGAMIASSRRVATGGPRAAGAHDLHHRLSAAHLATP